MFKQSADFLLEQIAESDIVLDIGGWAQPFNRANFVIDIFPYKTRGFFGAIGPEKEFFSKKTWIMHDVSSRKPLPFENNDIDFVTCSHILEDIRDPIYLCSEIVRVGKRGYIEIPSRTVESTIGLEGKRYAGYHHHRWLIEIENQELIFRFKTHLIHNSWRFHLPKSYLKKMREDELVSWLFWKDSFQYKEIIQTSDLEVAHELEEYVKQKRVYPQLFYLKDNIERRSKVMIQDILMKSPRLRTIIEKIIGKKLLKNVQREIKFSWNFI